MSTDDTPVLVTGATGQQGGATARALLAAGVPVRALVRDPDTDRATAVAALGAELVTGDLADPGSLAAAVAGVRSVFSVQMPALASTGIDFAGELTQAVDLIDAARAAGVPQFVQTTVAGAGQHTTTPDWSTGRWAALEPYYATKAGIQDRVRAAGFTHWTILKPGTFMENFRPAAAYLLPRGVQGGLATVLKPDTRLALIAVEDIGRAAAAAIGEPSRFHGIELDLAGDHLSLAEIAKVLSGALGTELAAPEMTEREAIAAGMPAWAAVSHEFINVAGQPGRPADARALGLPVTTFAEWAERHLAVSR